MEHPNDFRTSGKTTFPLKQPTYWNDFVRSDSKITLSNERTLGYGACEPNAVINVPFHLQWQPSSAFIQRMNFSNDKLPTQNKKHSIFHIFVF